MKKHLVHLIIICSTLLGLSSCRSVAPHRDYQALARSSIKLGMDIQYNDNPKLYINAAEWIGTPYRSGGTNKNGIDCSGLTSQLYKTVYKKKLPRSSTEQKSVTQKIAKRNLKEGDLVFFSTDRSKKKVSHVGIYLKNGLFIHASTSSGVRIDNIESPYYASNWIGGGRLN